MISPFRERKRRIWGLDMVLMDIVDGDRRKREQEQQQWLLHAPEG
jgi:hypothetical protein